MTAEEKRAQMRERQRRYRREGRCIGCGKTDERTTAGKSYCVVCAAKQVELQKARADRRREKGLCTICGKKARADGVLCTACAMRNAENLAKRYARLKAEGLCVTCGKKPQKPGRLRCEECSEKHRERAAAK